MKLASAAQMRELDRQAIEERKIPSIDLMDRAAEGVARAALSLLPERPAKCRAAVFCGSGNNGGDGIAAARILFLNGVKVKTFLVGDYEKLTRTLWRRPDVSQNAAWSWSLLTWRMRSRGPGC